MKIAVGVPVMNQKETTQEFFDQLKKTMNQKTPVILVDNGSNPPVRDWLIGLEPQDLTVRNPENIGVLPALNQIYQIAKNSYDYIFYTHNDVLIYEQGWDDKIRRILSEVPEVGVAGFYGAKGIGTPDIYRTPYFMQQMVRLENVSNCNRMDPLVHGFRNIRRGEWEEVAVMDGFSLIVSTELLRITDGFDRNYPVHHMYDNDICLESIDHGYRNIVIAMDAFHKGGTTDVGEDWATKFGKTKAQIHEEAHPIFYEKWKPGNRNTTLPFRVA